MVLSGSGCSGREEVSEEGRGRREETNESWRGRDGPSRRS